MLKKYSLPMRMINWEQHMSVKKTIEKTHESKNGTYKKRKDC
jgi:hypothetical protein